MCVCVSYLIVLEIRLYCVKHSDFNPLSFKLSFSLHITTRSCLRVTAALLGFYTCQQFQLGEYSYLTVVRIAKRWTSHERAITQSNARIFDSGPPRF